MKGWTTGSNLILVVTETGRILLCVRDRIKMLHLHAEVFFANGIGFVDSISDKLKFCTSKAFGSRSDEMLVEALKKIHET